MKLLFSLLILGQFLMAASIEYLDVNGTKVPLIYEEDKRLPQTTMQFVFTNAGSIRDEGIAGLAKMSARLLNEGTKTLGASAFADKLEAKAINLGATTGVETFVIEASSLTEYFPLALQNLDELLSDPNYTEDALDKIKKLSIGALSRKENDFDYVAANELKALLFEGTVLAQPSSGTIESVSSIKLTDIESFLKENLVSSKLIVVLGGDVNLDNAKEKISSIIEKMAKGEHSDVKRYETTKEVKLSILEKETEQAYIYFGSPYYMEQNDEDAYKARVATFILGTGGFGSRLMEEIRVKRGLAYSAYARVSISKSNSYMTGYLQTKTDSMQEAKETVKEVIDTFLKDGVTEEELEQTKKFLLGSEPLRVETMSQRLNRTFMEFYKGQELGYSTKELEKIRTLSLEDLNTFIKEHKEIQDLTFAIVTKK
jgi:zinc protease